MDSCENDEHLKKESEKTLEAHEIENPNVQNTLSLQYTFGGKKTAQVDNQKTMNASVTPRGTQCDTLCIIAGIVLLIFATGWREKGQLCPQM